MTKVLSTIFVMKTLLHFVCTLCLLRYSEAYFVEMLGEMSWRDGRQLCEDIGMTLPVLPGQSDFANFVDVRNAISSAYFPSHGYHEEYLQVWLGLTHDGSNLTAPEHFTWTDGSNATYIVADDLDLQGLDGNRTCVRLHSVTMRTTACNWKRSVICQGNSLSLNSGMMTLYAKETANFTRNTGARFTPAGETSSLQTLRMRNSGSVATDMIDCFLRCVQTPSCDFVGVLPDKSCYSQV